MKLHALLLLVPFATAAGPVDETPIPDPDVGQHGMVGERLRMIMENINATVHDTGSVDGDRDKLTRNGLDDMIEAVQELMYFAEFMTLNPPRRDLGENQIVTFRALASQLYTEALNVRDIARDYDLATHDFELLNSAYERLYQTCAACHELFRDR
jgi:hypothetical protein